MVHNVKLDRPSLSDFIIVTKNISNRLVSDASENGIPQGVLEQIVKLELSG
jgi:hypothetical protein